MPIQPLPSRITVRLVDGGETPLRLELRQTAELGEWVREQLYALQGGRRRATATTAIAAAAAEATHRVSDRVPEWQNGTSAVWREHLAEVWRYLGGEHEQHYALSRRSQSSW